MAQALRESENPNIRQIEWVAGGPQLSVRESRRVKGLYVLTEQDSRGGQRFDDVIAWRSSHLVRYGAGRSSWSAGRAMTNSTNLRSRNGSTMKRPIACSGARRALLLGSYTTHLDEMLAELTSARSVERCVLTGLAEPAFDPQAV